MEDDFSLVKRRNKRSTAGNRMQALMSGVLELEDAFMEVENDEDFVGKDEEDLFDDDFQETDEDDTADDTEAGERALQREEHDVRKVARGRLSRSSALPRIRLKLSPTKIDGVSPRKKRRVAMGAVVDAETGEFVTRSSQRQSTVTHTQKTKARMMETSQRQALHRKRPKTVVPVKTQDVLIREALELEERNVASLADFLNKEEEKKRQARVVRTRIEAPVVRWISCIEKPLGRPHRPGVEDLGTPEGRGTAAPSVVLSGATLEDDLSPPDISSRQQETSEGGEFVTQGATPPLSVAHHVVDNSMPLSTSSRQSLGEVGHNRGSPSLHRDLPPAPATNSPSAVPPTAPAMPLETDRQLMGGLVRNYVVLEVARGSDRNRYKMSDTEAFLNGRKEWSRHAAEEQEMIRARAQLLRDPTCAVTGLRAKYLEPRSGIPYANIRGYQALSKVLQHEYVWAQGMGCYVNDASDEGAEGVPPEWSLVNQKGGKMRPPAQPPFKPHASALSRPFPSSS
ncbi:hypothetical protein FS837_004439 [Tulasnella sp. UAMH 9824]|nr:hypothetical protein FS837_004439 [Tulasnella sp. UAMH 9824]